MTDEKYLTHEDKGHYLLKLQGELRYTDSIPFDNYLQYRIFADPAFKSVTVDLTGTLFMDSTNLGLLATLAVYQLEEKGIKMKVLHNDGDIHTLLESSGFEEIIEWVQSDQEAIEPGDYASASAGEGGDLQSTMLRAHETLSELSESNRAEFKSVVDALKQSKS